jgi:hypothetical protein
MLTMRALARGLVAIIIVGARSWVRAVARRGGAAIADAGRGGLLLALVLAVRYKQRA